MTGIEKIKVRLERPLPVVAPTAFVRVRIRPRACEPVAVSGKGMRCARSQRVTRL